MSYLQQFIDEYKELSRTRLSTKGDSLKKTLKTVQLCLLDERFYPSNELKTELSKLQIRSEEPMKIAITGQFSSGKSTFLNALLSKNILPTGITPVTSKVNYIRYGKEFAIKVRYIDGRDEYHGIEGIKKFTDQRENIEDVEYLSIYAPLDLLKDVIFVDTPGLNSQAVSDTLTTQNVLKEVDGIIWLTLIDNAGKQSEAEVLKEFMSMYQNKSLCVLNQKDKFTDTQIEQTLSYVKEVFSDFFSDVIPISALQALEARSQDKKHQIDTLLQDVIENIKKHSASPSTLIYTNVLQKSVEKFQSQAKEIYEQNNSKNINLLKKSNIELVLDFIHKEIQPISQATKHYSITQDVKKICESLIVQHKYFINIYDDLINLIVAFEKDANIIFEQLKKQFSHELKKAYLKVEHIIEKIATEIYNHISKESRIRYAIQKKNFFHKKEMYESVEYEVSKIETDSIYKKLFFDDDVIGKMFKKYVKNLRTIQDAVNEENSLIYKNFENSFFKWQKKFESVRKKESLHSDIEFANIRKFASKGYENFLKPFSDEIHSSYASVSSQFNHLSSAISFNYQNATGVSIGFLERKINASVKLYEENPTKFPLYQPKLEEIKERLKTNFHLYELQNMMDSKNSFLHKNYDRLTRLFERLKEDKIKFLEEKKSRHRKLINVLNEIQYNL